MFIFFSRNKEPAQFPEASALCGRPGVSVRLGHGVCKGGQAVRPDTQGGETEKAAGWPDEGSAGVGPTGVGMAPIVYK